MRANYLSSIVLLVLFSCNRKSEPIVKPAYADSLIDNFSTSEVTKTADENLSFWKNKMDSSPEDYVNGPQYAAALSSQFHLNGNIKDLLKADSLFQRSIIAYKDREPGIYRTLAYIAISQHQFNRADSLLKKVVAIEGQTVPNAFLDFDVTFEKGDYRRAKDLLATLKGDNSYGFLFRKSKFEHYDGSLDTAIACMMQAAEKPGIDKQLKKAALSNAGDLCLHKGDVKKANSLYRSSINIDGSDLHSIMGLGWIALIHDKNDSLAERIFTFVQQHTSSPDVLLKLLAVAEARNDSTAQKGFATAFIEKASSSDYGGMYSKYLIDLYTTGIINEPAKAVLLAEKELTNRATPQTHAWYVWSLYCNNEKEKAYQYFKSYVSSQPLEGPELYYMGVMMKGMDKQYNAQQFFKAAWKNRYDLSPAKQKYLEENLE